MQLLKNLQISPHKVIQIACVTLLLSTITAEVLKPPQWFLICLCVCGVVLMLLQQTKVWVSVGVLLLVGALGLARYESVKNNSALESYMNTKVQFTGLVVREPIVDTNKSQQRSYVRMEDYDELVLIRTTMYPSLRYGDQLILEGKLTPPNNYLLGQGASGEIYYPKIELLKRNQGNKFIQFSLGIKKSFIQILKDRLQGDSVGLVSAVVLGDVSNLSQTFQNNLKATGTSHIASVSGMNINILLVSMATPLAFVFGRKKTIVIVTLCLCIYLGMTGLAISALRAAVMGMVYIILQYIGRPYATTKALLYTAVLFTLYNPFSFLYDIGFQLSFAATLGIAMFVPLFTTMTKYVHVYLQNCLLLVYVTCAAVLFTLPVLIFHFGTVSLIGILVNLLIVPIVSIIMFLSFLLPLPGIGFISAKGIMYITEFVSLVISKGANIPFAVVSFPPSPLLACACLALVFVLYFSLDAKVRKNMRIDSERGLW